MLKGPAEFVAAQLSQAMLPFTAMYGAALFGTLYGALTSSYIFSVRPEFSDHEQQLAFHVLRKVLAPVHDRANRVTPPCSDAVNCLLLPLGTRYCFRPRNSRCCFGTSVVQYRGGVRSRSF